jgi:uncharacterized alkaline shock family protein YloU
MARQSVISPDVLARYAADAARGVPGVADVEEGHLHRGKGVAVSGDENTLAVAIGLELEWGRSAPEIGREAQRRIAEYLERMANVSPVSIDVVFDAVSSSPPRR